MTPTPCPECRQAVPADAETCPNCGRLVATQQEDDAEPSGGFGPGGMAVVLLGAALAVLVVLFTMR